MRGVKRQEGPDLVRFPVERTRATRLVALSELREHFGFSERWWRYRIKEPGFPVHRWRGGLRFDCDEVAEWLDRLDQKRARDAATSGRTAKPD
jgi:hypothetical protein